MSCSTIGSATANDGCNLLAARPIASLSTLPARIIAPAFPQRSPPRLLTAAACGGLRPAPDCRPRRALLHLSYSCAKPCGPGLLVTHGPQRTPWCLKMIARRAYLSPSLVAKYLRD